MAATFLVSANARAAAIAATAELRGVTNCDSLLNAAMLSCIGKYDIAKSTAFGITLVP